MGWNALGQTRRRLLQLEPSATDRNGVCKLRIQDIEQQLWTKRGTVSKRFVRTLAHGVPAPYRVAVAKGLYETVKALEREHESRRSIAACVKRELKDAYTQITSARRFAFGADC